MLYVLLILVVVLAGISGAEYAMLRVARAERRAAVAELESANYKATQKLGALVKENAKLTEQLARVNNIKEGIN
jgi:hypothetical protein